MMTVVMMVALLHKIHMIHSKLQFRKEKKIYIKWNMERMRQLWDLKSNLIGIKALDKALNAFTKSTSLHTSLYINLSIGFNKRFNINSSGTM